MLFWHVLSVFEKDFQKLKISRNKAHGPKFSYSEIVFPFFIITKISCNKINRECQDTEHGDKVFCGKMGTGMENDVMLGGMSGERRRGRPRARWLDTLET